MAPTFAGRASVNGVVRDIYWPDPLGTCPVCRGSGYRTVDIGTITIPDFVEFPCACNPAPTDADAPDRLECMDETWEHSDPAIVQQCDREPDRCTCRAYCDAMDAYYGTHPWHDDRAGYPGETEYPECDVPVVDYDERAA